GGFISSPPLLILSAAVTVLGAVSARMIYKKKDVLAKEDPFESLLVEKALQAEKEEDTRFAEWRAWLKQKKLDEYLSPLQAEKVLMIIQQIKGSLRQRAGLEDRLNHMRETADKASRLIGEISPLLKIPAAVDTDTGAMADIISHAYDEAVKNHEQKTNRQVQIEALENKIARLRKQLDDKNGAFLSFIRSVGAADEKDFDLKRSQLETTKSLKKTADENQGFIQSRVGFGKAYDNFLESLKQTPPEEIQHRLDRITEQLDKLHESRDRLNQAVGEIRNRINQLSSGNDLLSRQNELEIKKERLNRYAQEWAACKIALFILEQAKQKYEQERQPDVIRAAEEIFSKVTGGEYRRIFKPFDNDEILVDNGAGQSKGVIEMSRGAREQLYLSMRLGLIKEYEARSEPLPVIMDDVLVNLDERRARTMDILNNFAQSRQIIILTCHQQALESYKKLGANQIAIS
ncbi:MAG: ATP-binding protein, partial [Nitrospinales bacterium]